jgi:hypothetical protein
MARANWLAPFGAILSSLATLACCLPFAFLAAIGTAGVGVYLARFRVWLLGLSIILLGLGFYQHHRGAKCNLKTSKLNLIFLWAATAVVVLVLLFPQLVASLLAGSSTGGVK